MNKEEVLCRAVRQSWELRPGNNVLQECGVTLCVESLSEGLRQEGKKKKYNPALDPELWFLISVNHLLRDQESAIFSGPLFHHFANEESG